MYYINPAPDERGNYGNPQGSGSPNDLILPDGLLPAYLDTMGFSALTVEDNVITAVDRNKEAYNAYKKDHPDPGPEPEEVDDTTLLLEMAADHEERICLLEMGVEI